MFEIGDVLEYKQTHERAMIIKINKLNQTETRIVLVSYNGMDIFSEDIFDAKNLYIKIGNINLQLLMGLPADGIGAKNYYEQINRKY